MTRFIQIVVLALLGVVMYALLGTWGAVGMGILGLLIIGSSDTSSWSSWHDGINPGAWMSDLFNEVSDFGGGDGGGADGGGG